MFSDVINKTLSTLRGTTKSLNGVSVEEAKADKPLTRRFIVRATDGQPVKLSADHGLPRILEAWPADLGHGIAIPPKSTLVVSETCIDPLGDKPNECIVTCTYRVMDNAKLDTLRKGHTATRIGKGTITINPHTDDGRDKSRTQKE